jgi:hypothetical protein
MLGDHFAIFGDTLAWLIGRKNHANGSTESLNALHLNVAAVTANIALTDA